jgi:head-tail adaptor
MAYNIRAGRLRDQLRFYLNTNDTDDYGEPVQSMEYVAERRGEVQVKSGRQLEQYGTVLTEQICTVLMWYDPNIRNNMTMDWVNDSGRYNIEHIQPDNMKREMVVTVKLESKVLHLEPPTVSPGTPIESLEPIVVTADGLHAFYVINHTFPVTPRVVFTDQNGDETLVDIQHLSPTSIQVSGNTPLIGLITVTSGL